jgi:hypothetical protein
VVARVLGDQGVGEGAEGRAVDGVVVGVAGRHPDPGGPSRERDQRLGEAREQRAGPVGRVP